MQWALVLYGVIPLLVFVLVEYYGGLKWAAIAAALAGSCDILLTYVATGELDPGSFVALALLVGLGWYSVKRSNPFFFKLQPAILSAIFAGILAYYQFFSITVAVRYKPLLSAMIPGPMRPQVDHPAYYQLIDYLATWMVGFFVVYALLMAYAAWRLSNAYWLLLRSIGFWGLLIIVFICCVVVHAGELSELTAKP